MLNGIPVNQPVAPSYGLWIVVGVEHKFLSTANSQQECVPLVSTPPSELLVVTEVTTSSVGVKPSRESPAASTNGTRCRKHKFIDGGAKGSGVITGTVRCRYVNRIALAKVSECVRMVLSPSRNDVPANMPHLADSKPAKEHMTIWCTGFELVPSVHTTDPSKPSKEQEQITWAHPVILEMSLRLVGLPE